MSTSVRVDGVVELSSADVSQELPLLSPQRDIHTESNTITKNHKKYICKIFVGTDQHFNSKVWEEACSIGIQCDLLAAVPLQKFGTESLEQPLSTNDTKEADLNISFQLTHHHRVSKSVHLHFS